LYSLQKTLRFELKPIGNTQEMLNAEKNTIEEDKNRRLAYEKTKPFFNKLHREFIDEALSNTSLKKLHQYFEDYKKFSKDKQNKNLTKSVDALKQELRQEIVNLFNERAKIWTTQEY